MLICWFIGILYFAFVLFMKISEIGTNLFCVTTRIAGAIFIYCILVYNLALHVLIVQYAKML